MSRIPLPVAAAVIMAIVAVLTVMLMLGSGHVQHREPARSPASVPAWRATTSARGITYDCAQVRRAVAAGSDHVPDGSYIWAEVAMECGA